MAIPVSTSNLSRLVIARLCGADEVRGDIARKRIAAWRARAEDLMDTQYALHMRRHKLDQPRSALQLNIDNMTNSRTGGKPTPESDPTLKALRRDLAELKAEMGRLAEGSAEAGRHAAALRELCERCEHGIRDAEVIEFDPIPVNAKPKAGESVAQAVERVADEIRALDAKLHEVESASLTAEAATKAAFEQIDELAEYGRPDLGALVSHGGTINFRKGTDQVLLPQGAGVLPVAQPMAEALFAWVHTDALKKKIAAQIKAEAVGGMDPAEQDRQAAALDDELLAAQRRLFGLLAQDDDIPPPPEAYDYRAALSLHSSMPAPTEV
jgi:hypothetical protein